MSERIGFDILRRVLRPTVRFLLRRSCTFQDFIKLAKVVFVDVARAEIEAEGQKPNVSRISMFTGLNRLDVAKLYRENEVPEERSENALGLVMMQWHNKKAYRTKAGGPRVLSKEEFRKLVRSITTNYSPGVSGNQDRYHFGNDWNHGLPMFDGNHWYPYCNSITVS